MYGAALATSLSNILAVAIMLTHFCKKKNTLRFAKPEHFLRTSGKIFAIGFSVFFVDLAMGLMTMLYNKRILQLLDNDALSVFGAIASVMLYVLPALFGADSLWFAMPAAEVSVAAVTAILMWKFTKKLAGRSRDW